MGAALAVCGDSEARDELGIGEQSSLFLLLTEGLTDPASWSRIVGAKA